MNKELIKFPVTTPIKVFCTNIYSTKQAQTIFTQVCRNQGTRLEHFNEKKSSKGTFISYTLTVTLTSTQMLEAFFAELGAVEGVRTVI